MKYKYNIFFFFFSKKYLLMASQIPFIRIENRYVLNYRFFSRKRVGENRQGKCEENDPNVFRRFSRLCCTKLTNVVGTYSMYLTT